MVMDDPLPASEADNLPLHGPHWQRPAAPQEAADFIPLRLLLQGSQAGIDVTRPDTVIGRHMDADVRLPLPDVSRRHCRFVFSEKSWQVFDLNSLNGIYVNGERVERATLLQDDVIRIGSYTFTVDLAREAHTVPWSEEAAAKPSRLLERIRESLARPTAESDQEKRQAS
jgi:pSer/pThr/pTyr-binding forkhead associated (FHA) protein